MEKYRIAKNVTVDDLKKVGFEEGPKGRIFKHLEFKTTILKDTHFVLDVTRLGRFLFYSNSRGPKLYISNPFLYSCHPSKLEGMTHGFKAIFTGYEKEMGKLEDKGIFTKVYKPGKKK
ncbi:MAG: hypothetical protein IKZ96_01555 [Bacilli bacterium]|nr:hypothetical protein [Bacilli bacterium]